MTVDLVVIGGGMAGMTAAASVSAAGGRVVVVERAPELGGNAVLSEGYVWTAPSVDVMARECPAGVRELQGHLVDSYPTLIEWLRSHDVVLSGPIDNIIGYGRGYKIDVVGYIQRCARIVTQAGGSVHTAAEPQELLAEGTAVTGLRFRTAEGEVEARAPWTLLATGGWQADPDMRERHLHPGRDVDVVLRSNPHSDGGGFRLGQQAGAAAVDDMSAFYGHLMAAPLKSYPTSNLQPLSQPYSEHAILLNSDGRRFVDESLADHFNTQALMRQPGGKGVLIADEWVRTTHVVTPYAPGLEPLDRFKIAHRAGANVAQAETLEELTAGLGEWGFDADAALQTVSEYNALASSSPERVTPPVARALRPLSEPPYYAVEVRPGVTFTHGGLQIDVATRAQDGRGSAIPGLLVAGAESGGTYHRGYCGGLALAGVGGLTAASTVRAEMAERVS